MAKETISKTSTKTEILEAYEIMRKKVSELENLKPQEIKEREEKQTLVKKVSEATSDTIVKGLADLKLKVATSFDQVEDALLAEQKKLAEIRQAISIQEELIDELYEIKVTADSLAAILLAHKEKKQEIETLENELKAELERMRDDFDTEMEQKKADWDKEKTRIQAELKEEKERSKKEHQREEEEFNYTLQLKRRKEQDEYNDKKKKAEQEFAVKISETQKALLEREETIKLKENEFKQLQDDVAKFEERLAKTIKDTETAITDKLKTQFGFENELLLKEHEGLLKLKEQTIQTLEARIKEQETFIKQLTQKTELADKSVKDIAIKAIESSAKVQLFETPAGKKGD
jgi:hypothetical protein